MPGLAPIAPERLEKILEADGFKVVYEDHFNWWLARRVRDIPLNIPKETGRGECVSPEIVEDVLFEAGIDHLKYVALREMLFGPKKPPH